MTVIVSSAEALELVERAPEFMDRIERAVNRLPPDPTLDSLLDLGPCVYLNEGRCGVYALRPDACRACYVWHESVYCGRQDFDMCVPAELNQTRLLHLRSRMIGEFDRGRRPFRGYLLPAVWLLSQRRDEYLAGADLSVDLDERWVCADLLEFPTPAELRREATQLDAVFNDEYNPMGFPRAARAKDRGLLRAFDLRV